MEVQKHGFIWEKEILQKIYNLTDLKTIKYTNKSDLPSLFNCIDSADISIKTTCSLNAVCMADCIRIYDAVSNNQPLHMIVIHYKQVDKTKKIISIIEVDLTNSAELLFGSITRSQIEELDKIIKEIPQKRKPTLEEYKKIYSFRDSLQKNSKSIHLDIKCNSQQSRLQCSFNHFQDFFNNNPLRIITKGGYINDEYFFRGISIISEIISEKRTFGIKPSIVNYFR